MKMKKNKMAFLITEIILCMLAVLFTYRIFDHETPEKKIAVIVENSGDKNWDSLINGLKSAAKVNNLHLIICNTDDIYSFQDEKELMKEQIDNGAEGFIICPAPGSNTKNEIKKICGDIPFIFIVEDAFMGDDGEKSGYPVIKPDNYKIGYKLGEGIVNDSARGKTKEIGVILDQHEKEKTVNTYKGFMDAIEDSDIKVAWTYSGIRDQDICSIVKTKSKVDYLVAMDNYSLDELGANSENGVYNGAQIYGIGSSEKSISLLDNGNVNCIVAIDSYDIGYRSVMEISKKLNKLFYEMKSYNVKVKVIYQKDLFTDEMERFLYSYE